MLLPTHYEILMEAIKKMENILIDKSNLQMKYNEKITISKIDIENLVKGLFYPDLPCAYFYIQNGHLLMDLRLCSVTKILTLGKATDINITSQIEESHNGRFSINHSMADNENGINYNIRNNILARCITVFYSFLETKDYTFLGYLLHIIQDSWSPVHTKREVMNKDINITAGIIDINNVFKNTTQITPSFTCDNVNHSKINNLIYVIIDNKIIMDNIYDEVKKINSGSLIDLSNIMNIIVKEMIGNCSDYNLKMQMLLILLGYNNIVNLKDSIPKKKINIKIRDIKNSKKEILDGDILKSPLYYDDLSHSLRRIYKIIMNSLYNFDVQNKIESVIQSNNSKTELDNEYLKIEYNNCNEEIRPYIKHFLYYPSQNSDYHFIQDCKLNLLVQHKELFDFASCDTSNILKLSLDCLIEYNDSKNINNSIIKLYNYLINRTFYMLEDNLNISVNVVDKKEFNRTPDKTSNYKSCLATNASFAIHNFKLDAKRIITDLEKMKGGYIEETDKLLIYKKKYKHYKKLYLQNKK